MTRKTAFFEGWFWFKFNNLGLAPEILGLAPELKILHQCFKRVKTKNQIVLGANSYVAEVAGEKLVGRTFLSPHPK